MPHTPAPWYFDLKTRYILTVPPDGWERTSRDTTPNGGQVIAIVPCAEPEQVANGELLARAPRLARVLGALVSLEHEPPTIRENTLREAQDLISELKTAGVV